MNNAKALKQTIDRMVEDAIRRIIPQVMNEVLIKTLVNSSVISETRNVINRQPAQKPAPQQRPRPNGRSASLNEMLDETAGSEFYEMRAPQKQVSQQIEDDDDSFDDLREAAPQRVESRLNSLPPELRGLAEGMDLDDDGGEMWDDSFGDAETVVPQVNEIRDVDRAAKAAGINFSRMKNVIAKTSVRPVRESAEDLTNKAQFEMQRLRRRQQMLEVKG